MKTLIYSLVPTVAAFNTASKFTREAEIKHGRVAMVSSLAIPLLDTLNPEVLGVNYVNSLDPTLQLGLLAVVGCSEFFGFPVKCAEANCFLEVCFFLTFPFVAVTWDTIFTILGVQNLSFDRPGPFIFLP